MANETVNAILLRVLQCYRLHARLKAKACKYWCLATKIEGANMEETLGVNICSYILVHGRDRGMQYKTCLNTALSLPQRYRMAIPIQHCIVIAACKVMCRVMVKS